MANTTNLDLVKPLGTDHALISVINGNMDKVDAYAGKVNESLAGVQDGLAIVAVGDTHAAITSGQFVYVKEHNTLPEGLYTASTNIAANGALSTSNLTADSKGGLNALSDQIANLVYQFSLAANSSVTVAHTASVLIYTDRGGMWTEGINGRTLSTIANSDAITVSRTDNNTLQIASTSGGNTRVVIITSGTLTIT